MRLTQEQIKKYYSRQSKPQILKIPKMKYITIEGQGNPNIRLLGLTLFTGLKNVPDISLLP